MRPQVLLAALTTGLSLPSGVSAGRMSDVARRKGYSPAAMDGGVEMQSIEGRAKPHYRFLNKNTTKYFVEKLPDIPFDLGEMYSGLVPIDMKNESRALFFVFQPKIGAPVDEITIWLNGGPGCSSLKGFLQENGRFIWTWAQFAATENPYSWVNLTNVLWVEQPVGTGFSIGDATATSEEDIAKDFNDFFLNFQNISGIKKI